MDAYPYPDLADMRAEQVRDLKEALNELDADIKLVCVCGNHDVGDTPTAETIQLYKQDFGEDYFSFWQGGCKFIVLNSQLYFDSSLVPQLKEEQDNWLDIELHRDTQQKHLIVFQHIPLFLERHDELDHDYFNIKLDQRKNLLDRFKKGGVAKVFCGHYHKNAGGFYEDIEVVVTSAVGAQLGLDGHGYRLVEVTDKQISHRYITVTDQVN